MIDLNGKLIDLHLHMDGSISLATAREIALSEGIDIPEADEELKKKLSVSDHCRDLNEYLECFAFPSQLLQTEKALETATRNLLIELKELGLMYAELRFAPQHHVMKGLTQKDVVKAVIKGTENSPIPCGIILCCMRGEQNERENLETLCVAEEFLGKGVCAVDLAGAEALFPNSCYESLFQAMREKKLPFTIHAGEAAGADSILDAIRGGALRIGHGIRCLEDDRTVELLREKQIPLEICPTSNLNTNVFPSFDEYPIRKLLEQGLLVTINSDNMSVSNTNVRKEYEKMIEHHKLNISTVNSLLRNSVKASFASEELKKKMLQQIEEQK